MSLAAAPYRASGLVLWRKADIRELSTSVKCQFRTHAPQRTMPSFDHLVGLDEQQLRHFETERKGIDALASAFAFDAMVSAFRRS
jgi:hypothetical protein